MSAAKKLRVDYSSLVYDLQLRQSEQSNRALKEMMPKLVDYLRVTMGADSNTAMECVQQAFLNVYERILEDKIRDPKSILSYFMQASRNEFINMKNKQKKFSDYSVSSFGMIEPAMQIEELIEEERMDALQICIDSLDEDSKEFINFFLDNPGIGSREVARLFNLSEANVRTKKSRLIKQLHQMYLEKHGNL
jgi:RNA polymerase sigma factor (sigma-70 family)